MLIELTVAPEPSLELSAGCGVSLEVGSDYVGSLLPEYQGQTDVTPSTSVQTLPTHGTRLTGDITVEPMPSGNVDMIGAGFEKESGAYWSKASITQGYVSPSGQYSSSKKYLDSVEGATIVPSASEQVAVEQYRWTKGQVKVAPIPNNYGLITWNGSVITVS